MVVNTVVIDHNGDTIITLTKMGGSFAVWDPLFRLAGSTSGEMKVSKKKKNKDKKGKKSRSALALIEGSVPEGSAVATADLNSPTTDRFGDASVDHEALVQSLANVEHTGEGDRDHVHPAYEPTADPEVAFEYLVSSKHLKVASRKFRSELAGPWSEGIKGEDGLYHLKAENWGSEVFSIWLNILHLRNHQVPSNLTLETLAKIATLVDYYQCWEAVAVWAKIWVPEVKKKEPVPTVYNRELILWMLIAWVFELPEDFSTTTKIAHRQSQTSVIQDMCLPIPPAVTEAIELRRNHAINAVISKCHAWIEKFRDTYQCPKGNNWSFPCGSILLGALTKGMHRSGYMSPKIEGAFEGHSFEEVCKTIKEMKSPPWVAISDDNGFSGYDIDRDVHGCSLQHTVGPDVDIIMTTAQGLSIYDFKDSARELGHL